MLDDGDDVVLGAQPLDGPVGRSAVDDDDLVAQAGAVRADRFDGLLQERAPIEAAEDIGNLRAAVDGRSGLRSLGLARALSQSIRRPAGTDRMLYSMYGQPRGH